MRRWPTLLIFVSTAITTQKEFIIVFLQVINNPVRFLTIQIYGFWVR
jgi:hypothetical protein